MADFRRLVMEVKPRPRLASRPDSGTLRVAPSLTGAVVPSTGESAPIAHLENGLGTVVPLRAELHPSLLRERAHPLDQVPSKAVAKANFVECGINNPDWDGIKPRSNQIEPAYCVALGCLFRMASQNR
jgi:hypothetical protein